jgi:hypothetical protein
MIVYLSLPCNADDVLIVLCLHCSSSNDTTASYSSTTRRAAQNMHAPVEIFCNASPSYSQSFWQQTASLGES